MANILNKDAHEALGTLLSAKFDQYDRERRQLEVQWLKNLRQYKGIYDPEVKIPEGRSRVYPKDTHTKIVGWTAKLMEMMFPAQELNFSVEPTPYPNIAQADLEQIIDNLEAEAEQAAAAAYQEALQQDPNAQPEPPAEITSDQIEKAVKEFAKQRATKMETECKDQLSDTGVDYPDISKRTIRRAGIFGFGCVEGPNVKTQKERVWIPGLNGFEAVEKKIRRPVYKVQRAWDVYPDLSASTWDDQEGLFTRKVYARNRLRGLADREDFFGEVIKEYLKENPDGNYKAKTYEAELNEIKHVERNEPKVSRLYEVLRWYGFLSAQKLADVGVKVPESALDKDILADVWLLDGKVIAADTAPFGEKVSDMYHAFIPEDDEDGPLTGTAKVEILRDSQLKLCAIDRATMDNMAGSAQSIIEVNDDLVKNGQDTQAITGGMTIHREGDGAEANYPAIRTYDIPNHIQWLLALREAVLQVFDVESNLPAWRMGDAKPLGEAFRTSNNMSMMAGGGDMVTKDDARGFDKFVKSLIGSLVRWNMEFNAKEDIKGDFQVMPKGVLSLVAKEVRGAALDQLAMTLSDRERAIVDERRLLIDRLKSRDLSTDYVMDEEEAKATLARMDEAQSMASQIQQQVEQSRAELQSANAQKAAASAQEIAQTVDVKIREALSRIAQNLAKAKGEQDGAALQSIKLLLDANKPEAPAGRTGRKAAGKAAKQ